VSAAARAAAAGEPLTGIGLISGTSADGIDAVVADLWREGDRLRFTLRAAECLPYPAAVRDLLFCAFANAAKPSDLCILHAALGDLFADAAQAAARAASLQPGELAFIASHGQTIWHQPDAVPVGDQGARGTLQLGDPARIAARLGVPVIADFRARDMALGGQGAPLVPRVDWLLLAHPTESRAVQNLGGIGNVTYLPAGGGPEMVVAFDTGPANALMDAAAGLVSGGALPCDEDGRLAAAAPPDPALLARLLAEPYFAQPPPKSTGRELFGAPRVQALWDAGYRGPGLVSTLAQLTVESIVRAYRAWLGPVDTVILAGGGARNPELLRRLSAALAPARVALSDEFGIPADAREALAFAALGYETLAGRPGNVPAATGAAREAVLGSITP